MQESLRIQAVQTPMIPVVGELIAQTPGTISLGQGVVSYGPPPAAIEQIQRFLADPLLHRYQAVTGIPELKALIAQKLAQENQVRVEPDRAIVVTAGSNMGFVNAVLAIADPGDEFILQTPYYFNHEMAVRMANCIPVLVETDADYQLQLQAIEAAIMPRTRAIVTISPNNPTGAVYSEADLRAVNELCRERGLYHIHDETYEYFTDAVPHFSPSAIPEAASYTISLYSLSKAYGFASWRIGYMVLPQHLLMAVQKIQDTIVICPAVISQYAAIGALQTGRSYCQPYLKAIAQVRQIGLARLAEIDHLCRVPAAVGAFYYLVKVNTSLDDFELVSRLIREHQVAALPGNTFGMRGCYLRVAYGALQAETAVEGIGRLVTGLKKIVH